MDKETPQDDRPRFIVGIGASAGGLEALQQLFERLPPDTGMSFIVVQHLSPDFKSLMDELLGRHTEMAVFRVENGMPVKRDSVYLIPPKKEMIVSNGHLLLTDKDPAQGLTLPIDHFFRSLAQDAGKQAIAIVLSGTGSDGSRGIIDVREAGGLVIAQDTESARFDGMPKSAVETGAVDLVLPPNEIAESLMRCAGHRLQKEVAAPHEEDNGVKRILTMLREANGLDFASYKPTTILRRIERRLLLQRASNLEEYCRRVQEDPAELNQLYRDLLIGVTQFFRDQDAFNYLAQQILPDLLPRIPIEQEIRMWVAACATGEEAYSLAMLVHEHLTMMKRPLNVKIFATDVHRSSLDIASNGLYSAAALANMTPERVKRYFTKERDGSFRVCNDLRNMIVFAPHNLLRDAPFTRLDMISCRNMLIYLQPAAQKKVLSLFHFALKASGVLFLGPSEGPGDLGDEFDALDQHWKFYRKRRDIRLVDEMRMPLAIGGSPHPLPVPRPLATSARVDHELLSIYDSVLGEFMPPALLLDSRGQLVHAFQGAGRYLSVPDGRPSRGILEQLPIEVRTAVLGSLQRPHDGAPVVFRRVSLASNQGPVHLDIGVRSVENPDATDPYILITFAEAPPPTDLHKEHQPVDLHDASREQIGTLESELRYTRENLQATIEELETSNEELQATNEELVASNEELQSTNEELHSVNEELYTVNAEHQNKINELTELTADMDSLLESTQVHTIFLDRDLCIRKFTPQIAETFHLLDQDIGRRIDSFSPSLEHPELMEEVQSVLASGSPIENEVSDRKGNWYLLRILPYDRQGTREGVVLTLIDITRRKQSEFELQVANRQFRDVLDNSPSLVFLKSPDGRYQVVNRPFEVLLERSYDQIVGLRDEDLFEKTAAAKLVANDRTAAASTSPVQLEETLPHPDGTDHSYLAIKFPVRDESGELIAIGGIKTDVTSLKAARDSAIEAVAQRDRFLAVLSHELRNPLSALVNAVRLLSLSHHRGQTSESAIGVIERQSQHMARLLDDLLDVSRVTAGKIEMRHEWFDLRELADEASEAVAPLLEEHQHQLNISLCDQPLSVSADQARMLQVIENLLNNAAKYTPDRGQIEIAFECSEQQATIRVRDNGQGIDERLQGSIFDMFVQSDSTLDRSEGGMGVGLTLVKTLVEMQGGTVSVQSDGIGKGSEFSVHLPLVESHSDAEMRVDNPHAAVSDSRKQFADVPSIGRPSTIVIIEDLADNREMLREILELEGCQVHTAPDGKSGLDLILQVRPQVALVDIGLPIMNGYEVAENARAKLGTDSVQLIALTGYGREEDREKVMNAGFDAHLVKPLSGEDIECILCLGSHAK